jgi:hypothetical protein
MNDLDAAGTKKPLTEGSARGWNVFDIADD